MKGKTIGKIKAAALSVAMCLQLAVPSVDVEAAQTFYDNKTGYEDGFDYELWKDYGSTSMTIKGGGNFECWWENIGNVLFRKGKKFDCTQTYQQIGNMTINFGVDYQPNGNSYLCVYGWTRNPLVEYYIVESWGSWRPPGANSKGQITVDGGTYDVYETTRVNQPSIDGNTTFQQYWSVRTSKRNSGTISVSQHFQAWERMGMKMGNIYEVAFNVEGYQSSGWADVYKNELSIGGSISSGGNNGGSGSGDNSNSAAPGTAQGTRIECEDMTISGQYAGTISSPFNGVALYANDESVSYTQNFTSGTHDFTLSGASNGDNLARVDLYIGGQNKGTFYYGDANHAEYTIKNVSHGTGNQKIELKVSGDDGTWDLYADALIISGNGVGGNSGNQGGNSGNQGGNTGNQGGNTGNQGGNTSGGNVSTGATMECEDMTKSGQYTGNVSNPFNGVALYANDDAVSFTQNFTGTSSNFTLTGASNGDNMARVDLFIGGQNKGTFYYGDANVAEYTIENVSHGTGNQKVELKVTADDGTWDAYIDCLTISPAGSVDTDNGSNAGNGGNSGNGGSSINPNGKMIALTFDDGPSSTTSQVLDVLDRYDVKATFFLVGQNINGNTRSILERQNASGHELANHSYTHSDMTNMSWSSIQNEINQTNNLIKQYTGQTAKFFRPPYISVNSTMYSAIDMAFVQGSMHNDWDGSSSSYQIANSVAQSAKDGQIILLHDFQGNSATVQALPTIIENLKNQGYQFVTMSQLFEYKGKNANVDYKIWSSVYD